MFSKTDKSDKSVKAERSDRADLAARPAPKNAAPSLVSANLQISGNLQTEGEIQIDGTVEGDITCKKLTVGETAVISGEIMADEVEVRGRVQGRIRSRAVLLAKSAQVVGDVWHDSLSIEAGAFLEGHCKRNDSIAPQEVKSKPAAANATEAEPAPKADAVPGS